MKEPKWKKEFRNRFVDDDGLMHNKYAANEIIKYFEEIIYDTFWRATAKGYSDAMKTKKTIKKILKRNLCKK